ncbi:pyridoxamine 5'-phosphate oxidase family protein [Camelimonas fluminis]|uniref:Pyridoxamine 5'-phosphate oxidase family protein n=2 Tax=Camelimonas fluminis TaxID=1576911 RepID=A0ABV7UDR2_9HYPH
MTMRLDDRLLEFLRRPLMCIIAGVDQTGRPSAGRGVGFNVLEDRTTIDLIFSGWQWPRLVSDIRQTGRLAVTFVSPADYVSFQLKGRADLSETEVPNADHAARFITAATDELQRLGVAPHVIAPWLTAQGARLARLSIQEIYIQTPGPHAGMMTGAEVR